MVDLADIAGKPDGETRSQRDAASVQSYCSEGAAAFRRANHGAKAIAASCASAHAVTLQAISSRRFAP
jgi:hypothetical protein